MTDLSIQLADGRTELGPGETVHGTAGWKLHEPAESLEIRLLWYTQGKGIRDAKIVDRSEVIRPRPAGELEFDFTLPPGPRSFEGKLVQIRWALELVALPQEQATRLDLTVRPLAG